MAYGARGGGAMTQDLGGLARDLSSRLEVEHTVLEARAQELRREARKQARQRAFLREERKRARDEKEAIIRDAAKLEHRDKDDWFPRDYLDATPQKRLRLNVGGQISRRPEARQRPRQFVGSLGGRGLPVVWG